MFEKKTKNKILLFYAIAFFCCALAIIMLLMSFTVTKEKTLYIAPSGGTRTEVSSESTDSTINFFDYVEYLGFHGWSATFETIFIVSLFVNLVCIIALAFVAIKKATFFKKKLKFVFVVLSAFPLISLVLATVIQADSSAWKHCGSEFLYSGYDGSIYEETLVKGAVLLVPVIIFLLIALTACIGNAVLIIKSQTQVIECGLSEESTFDASTVDEKIKNNSQSSDLYDELSKYKGLLDDGVITQEEFEAKRKKILNL